MTRATLTRRALDDIWAFSIERWGFDQAEVYLRDIDAAIRRVADDPRRGRLCNDVRRGYRKYIVGSHILFYRSASHGIQVVRVLHQRMNFARHL